MKLQKAQLWSGVLSKNADSWTDGATSEAVGDENALDATFVDGFVSPSKIESAVSTDVD
jgi:hypothetical protein